MSDSVNDYALGAPNTQDETNPAPRRQYEEPDPLAHGLGDQDLPDDDADDGRRLGSNPEHGLGEGGALHDPAAAGVEPDPLAHGLGSPDSAPPDDLSQR
ncbi:MAG TPA: hypothetical protein PKV13_08265 [Propionicimonas sp.]|nr:hypothetical protein [Propionicimonas sp.]HRA06597.1 hypothetical protein [Propionicimonas sp.]